MNGPSFFFKAFPGISHFYTLNFQEEKILANLYPFPRTVNKYINSRLKINATIFGSFNNYQGVLSRREHQCFTKELFYVSLLYSERFLRGLYFEVL